MCLRVYLCINVSMYLCIASLPHDYLDVYISIHRHQDDKGNDDNEDYKNASAAATTDCDCDCDDDDYDYDYDVVDNSREIRIEVKGSSMRMEELKRALKVIIE